MDVSVVLVNYNTINVTRTALDHLFKSSHHLMTEVFIIDNASRDGSADALRQEYPNITLIENQTNVGFGRANNQAVPFVKGKYVLLLNTDAFVAPDTIQKTYTFMETNPDTGILGVRLVGRDGVLQPSCRYFPTPWNIFINRIGLKRIFRIFKDVKMVDDMDWNHESVRQCDWVPGCYYMVRKEVIDQIGLFDPRYFLYFEEVDHCFAAKQAGWNVTYFPDTTVVHIGGESAKYDNSISSVSKQIVSLQIESELLYYRKNHGLFDVMEDVILTLSANVIQLIKDALKLRQPASLNTQIRHIWLVVTTFWQTRMGSKSLH